LAENKYLLSAGKPLSALILLVGIILIAGSIIDTILTAEFITVDGTEILASPNLLNNILIGGFGVVLAVFGFLLFHGKLSLLLFNVVVSVFFLAFNIYLWIPSPYGMAMTPLTIELFGPWFGSGVFIPNFLFWLFWLSTAVNLYFIINIKEEKKQNPMHKTLEYQLGRI
jgi:hypothetical protein